MVGLWGGQDMGGFWRAAIVGCAIALAGAAQAAPSAWMATWGAAPQPPSPGFGPIPASPSFERQTIRQVVRISAGGRRLRVRLTNEYGAGPLEIGAAHVALAGPDGSIRPGTDRVLTFGGKPAAVIPPGAPLLSDPVEFEAPALSRLSVSLYLAGKTGPCTCHGTGLETGYVSGEGDFTGAETFPTASTIQARAFLSGLEVAPTAPSRTIVVLGDSISDGLGSTADADRRWPDLLAERLAARDKGSVAWGVVNEGISGNRLLHDGAGQSALGRFDRDVLAQPGVAYVVVLEGINDIGLSHLANVQGPLAEAMRKTAGEPVTAEDMIFAYRQIVARAHAHGLKVYGVTLTPYEGAAYASPEGEADRQAVNQWIRTSGVFDGVLDFDAVWRDPADGSQIAPGLHAGDHLHGSDAGYKAAADSIDLSLFR